MWFHEFCRDITFGENICRLGEFVVPLLPKHQEQSSYGMDSPTELSQKAYSHGGQYDVEVNKFTNFKNQSYA
jgi:hypothetical protein